jgi:hypothetical protein
MMFESNGEQLPEVLDAPEFIQRIELYDQTRCEFLNACSDFDQTPSAKNSLNMTLCGALVIKTFGSSVEAIVRIEPNFDDRINMIAGLMIADDAERAEHFQNMTECPDFKVLKDTSAPDFASVLKDAAMDIDEDFNKTVLSMYQTAVEADLVHFVEHCAKKQGTNSELSRQRLIARTIGKNALDIAKIGAGVALGIWVTRQQRSH